MRRGGLSFDLFTYNHKCRTVKKLVCVGIISNVMSDWCLVSPWIESVTGLSGWRRETYVSDDSRALFDILIHLAKHMVCPHMPTLSWISVLLLQF